MSTILFHGQWFVIQINKVNVFLFQYNSYYYQNILKITVNTSEAKLSEAISKMTEYGNPLKSIFKNSNFKQSLNKLLLNNSDQSYVVDKIDKNWQRYTILLSNIDQTRKPTKGRWIASTSVKLIILMSRLRFFLSSVFSKKWVIILMSDSTYLLGNQRAIAAMYGQFLNHFSWWYDTSWANEIWTIDPVTFSEWL